MRQRSDWGWAVALMACAVSMFGLGYAAGRADERAARPVAPEDFSPGPTSFRMPDGCRFMDGGAGLECEPGAVIEFGPPRRWTRIYEPRPLSGTVSHCDGMPGHVRCYDASGALVVDLALAEEPVRVPTNCEPFGDGGAVRCLDCREIRTMGSTVAPGPCPSLRDGVELDCGRDGHPARCDKGLEEDSPGYIRPSGPDDVLHGAPGRK